MTKEEIVKIAKGLRTDFKCESDIMVDFCNSIIKELEQEPTTKNDLGVDCINRQAAITFVCKNIKEILKDTIPLEVKLSDDYLYENTAKIMRNSKVLPSVTPQEPRWIPVTERLPDNSGRYLVNYNSGYVGIAHYYESVSKWGCTTTERIVKWMPLPEAI